MKIGLVDPGSKKLGPSIPHLGLGYIASVLLDAGYDVRVVDLGFSEDRDIEDFCRTRFNVVGVTATYFSLHDAVNFVDKIRERDFCSVLGGPYPSSAREKALLETGFDFAIFGEGEFTFLEFVERIEDGCGFDDVPGLIHRKDEGIVVNVSRDRIGDVDGIPFPAYHLFPMEQYEKHAVLGSRGCPFNCVFCDKSTLWGEKWIARSPANIVDEIEFLIYEYGEREVDFLDYCFNANNERVKLLCSEMRDRVDVKWNVWGLRAKGVTEDLAKAMKLAGCNIVSVGIESASQRVLDNVGKNEKIEEIREGLENMKKAGLNVYGMFMIGNPGDNLETIDESIDFAEKYTDYSMFSLALPYPNTGLYEYAEQTSGLLVDDFHNMHHRFETPYFETQDFTKEQRIKALEKAKKRMQKMKIKDSVKTVFKNKKISAYGLKCHLEELTYLFGRKDERLYNAHDIMDRVENIQ
jgi:anaerobic magnesium-protoporphyrin IX monomethyl ester cyclase